MKNKRLSMALGLVVLTFMLGGCTDPMYELTKEEESLIAQYAAHIVSKHNIRQTDGMTGVLPTESELTEEEPEETETTTETSTETETGKDDSTGSSDETVKVEKITMAEALGCEGLTVKFVGSEQIASYQEGDAYSLDAEQGKVFYLMNFELSNATSGTIKVDNISLNPRFKLTGTELNVKAEITILGSDLSTFAGEIKAGETHKTVLLFEIPQDKVEAAKQADFGIIIDGKTKSIEL